MLKALIFDADGTIADTESLHLAAFNISFDKAGLGFNWSAEEYLNLLQICGGKERVYNYLLQYNNTLTNDEARELAQYIHNIKGEVYADLAKNTPIKWRAGIKQTMIDALEKGIEIAIATTTQPQNLDVLMIPVFGNCWRKYFAAIGDGKNITRKKPDSAVYSYVLDTMRISPHEAIAFEDSQNGLAAAIGANIRTIITKNFFTQNHDFTGAFLVADDLPHAGRLMQCQHGFSIECLKTKTMGEANAK